MKNPDVHSAANLPVDSADRDLLGSINPSTTNRSATVETTAMDGLGDELLAHFQPSTSAAQTQRPLETAVVPSPAHPVGAVDDPALPADPTTSAVETVDCQLGFAAELVDPSPTDEITANSHASRKIACDTQSPGSSQTACNPPSNHNHSATAPAHHASGSQTAVSEDNYPGFSRNSSLEPSSQEPQSIGHFRLLKKLGAGAFGAVYQAHDTKLDRIVALKIPKCGHLSQAETDAFLREARAAAQLRHPQIVGVHEVGQWEGRVYLVTDFIAGQAMDDWLEDQRPTFAEAAQLITRIAAALNHAHSRGVVHRDLKPANILLDHEQQPHVADFGLAKRDNGDLSQTTEGSILGTPAYMAPEQASGNAKDADGRADIYSIGVMLFEMLTGERPFQGNLQSLLVQIVHSEAPRPRKLNAEIPKDLETICLRCLEKDPARRFQTAAELAAELERYLNGEPILSRPISVWERVWRYCQRNRTVAALGLTVALTVLIGGCLSLAFGAMAWSQRQENSVLSEKTEDAKRQAIEAAVREDLERLRRQSAERTASTTRREMAAQKKQAAAQEAELMRELEQQALSNSAVDRAVQNFAAENLGNGATNRRRTAGNLPTSVEAQQKLLNQLKGKLGKLNSTLARPRGR